MQDRIRTRPLVRREFLFLPSLGSVLLALPVLTLLLIGFRASATGSSPSLETLDTERGGAVKFVLHLPSQFKADQTYPVLIGPGSGRIQEAPGLFWGSNPTKFGWIVVETPALVRPDRKKLCLELFDHLEDRFQVEGGKFHLVGFSANSGPVFEVAIAHPKRILSVTGIPGYPRATDPTALEALSSVRIALIVGERDSSWLRSSKRAHERLKKVGVHCTLEIIPNGGHVLAELTGRRFMSRMNRLRPEDDSKD